MQVHNTLGHLNKHLKTRNVECQWPRHAHLLDDLQVCLSKGIDKVGLVGNRQISHHLSPLMHPIIQWNCRGNCIENILLV